MGDCNRLGVPEGFKLVNAHEVWVGHGLLVVTGVPEEELDEGNLKHNCDAMGCGQAHVLYKVPISEVE